MVNYIKAHEFSDFKKNQEILIGVLNHSVTELKEDVKCQTKDINSIARDVSEIKGNFSVIKKIVWWLVGIIGSSSVLITLGANFKP